MALNRQASWEQAEQAKTLDAAEAFFEVVAETGSDSFFATDAGHSIQANLPTGIICVSWLDPAQDIISLTVDTDNSDIDLTTASEEGRIRLCAYLTARLALSRAIQIIKRYRVERHRSDEIPSALSLIDAQLAKVGCDPDYWQRRSKTTDVRLVYRAMDELWGKDMLPFDDCTLTHDQKTFTVGLIWTWKSVMPVGVLFDAKTGKPYLPPSVPQELVQELRGRGVQCITEMALSLRLFMPLYREDHKLFCKDVHFWLEGTRPE